MQLLKRGFLENRKNEVVWFFRTATDIKQDRNNPMNLPVKLSPHTERMEAINPLRIVVKSLNM